MPMHEPIATSHRRDRGAIAWARPGLALAGVLTFALGAPAEALQGAREPITVYCEAHTVTDEPDPEKAADRQRGIDDSLADLRAGLSDSQVLRVVGSPEQAEVRIEVLDREGSRLELKSLELRVSFRDTSTVLRPRTLDLMSSWKSLIDQAKGALEGWASSSYYQIKDLPPPEVAPGVVLPEVQEQIDELGKRDAVARARAAMRLRGMGERALPAAPALVAILDDATELEFRMSYGTTTPGEQAGLALIAIGAFDALVEAFRTSESWRARQQAVEVLAQVTHPSVEPVIGEGLRDEEALVRRAASDALGFGGASREKHPAVIDPLIAALEDRDTKTRRNAARALHFRPAVRSIEPLIGRLDDKGDVREAAAKALARLTGQDLGEDAAAWRSWWSQNQATFELPRHLRPR